MTRSGPVAGVLGLFLKLIAATFCMTLLLLLFQFTVAGLAAPQNPLRMLRTMLAAYVTALGTQSSAATIPVTLTQTLKLGVRRELASFVIPLCATIHLSGSMLKITACAPGRGDDRRPLHPDRNLRGFYPAAGRYDGGGPVFRAARSWRHSGCSNRCSASTKRSAA